VNTSPSRNFFDAQTKIISTAIINVIQEWLRYTHLARTIAALSFYLKLVWMVPEKIWITEYQNNTLHLYLYRSKMLIFKKNLEFVHPHLACFQFLVPNLPANCFYKIVHLVQM
jgi:hypothetical protein